VLSAPSFFAHRRSAVRPAPVSPPTDGGAAMACQDRRPLNHAQRHQPGHRPATKGLLPAGLRVPTTGSRAPRTTPRLSPTRFGLGLTVAVALTGLAACQGEPAPEVVSPSPVALPRLDQPATLATTGDTSFDAEAQAAMADLGIITGSETRQDAYGTWNPLTIAPDAAVLSVDPDAPSRALDAAYWTPDIVAQAWRDLATFVVSDFIDSEVAWDDTPANRTIVSDRIAAVGFHNPGVVGQPWAFLGYLDGTSMAGPFPLSAYMMGDTPYGPWALDQDYRDWRVSGPPADFDHRGNEAYHDRVAAVIRPATPAPYQSGQPRTWVTALSLRSAVPNGERPNVANFTVDFSYVRPLQFTATGTRGYELNNRSLTVKLASVDGHAYLAGFFSAQANERSDRGLLDADALRRLALLPGTTPDAGPATDQPDGSTAETPVATESPDAAAAETSEATGTEAVDATGTQTSDATATQTSEATGTAGSDAVASPEATSPGPDPATRARVGQVSFDLPDGATRDGNHSCGAPTDQSGTIRLAYDLPPTALGEAACFKASRTPADADWFTGWWLYPTTTTWGVDTGDFVGAVDITTFAHWDEIAIEFYDGQGGQYSFDLTVPAGTGPDAAARLINSLRWDESPASPSATETASPASQATSGAVAASATP